LEEGNMLVKLVGVYEPDTYLEKEDPDAQRRIGRTFDLDKSFIKAGRGAFLYCIYPDFGDSLCTSRVLMLLKRRTRLIIITKNSIYVLEEVAR